jgi:hypothetical protein
MAQEQAKTPSAAAAAGGAADNPFDIKGTSAGDIREDASFAALDQPSSTEGQKKPSLAERLRAEQQRKTPEPKMDETKSADLGDAAATAAARAAGRRRPAGPPPRRMAAAAANDDLPSIGGLIFALQQKPSKSPFLVTLVASLVWFIVGGFFAYGLISTQLAGPGGLSDLLTNPSALTAALTILVPIAIFWFLALLVWRAQELRLMASAMTEVAVRLAEPDKLAEQSVASLGQTIRRQVAAMNDAISRAIGRAGELEALVHNEVAALERSYSDNELRVRGLISELASEREALSNNSQRVSESLRGVGQEIARNLSAASSSIDQKLAERGMQLTELLVARSNEAAEQVERAQNKVQENMPILLERLGQEQERLGQVIEGAARNLSALEVAVGQRTSSLDYTLKERTEALTTTLASRINALETTVAHGALILDKTLKDRTDAFTASIGQGAVGLDGILKERTRLLATSINEESASLDKTLKDRTEAFATLVGQGAIGLDKTLKDRTDAFAALVGQSALGLDTVMKERTKLLAASVNEQSAALDKTLKERTEAFVTTVGHGALGLDRLLKDRTEAFAATVGEQATALDRTLQDRSEQLTTSIGQGSAVLDKALQERTEALASTIGFGAATVDKALKERIQQLASSIGQGTEALASTLGYGAATVDKALKERIQQLASSIGQGTEALDRTLQGHGEAFNAALTHQAALLGQSLKERTEALASAINQGAISLDRTLADRSEAFTNSLADRSKAVALAIGEHTAAMDKQLADRTHEVTTSLTERLQSIDNAFGQRAGEIDRVLAEHARAVEVTFGRQASHLNELLASNSIMIKQTADQVGAQSTEAIGVLTAQTHALREVSSGLLEQIHNLTQRFENQGQAILTAAKALDSSNTKIDSILENRHQAIIGLLHAVNTKGADLDNVMRSYAGMVENALTNAETRAKQVGSALARDTAGQAQQALSQIERLREEAQAHTARAVGDLKSSFETVITQIGRQLEQMRGQFDNASRGMRDAAEKTATDLDSIRQEMQRRMEGLPQQTAQATAAIRKALADQLKEIEAITPVLTRPQIPSGPEPYRQPQLPPRRDPFRGDEGGRAPQYDAPPQHRFDAPGDASEEPLDLGAVAGSLSQQMSAAQHTERRGPGGNEAPRTYPPQGQAEFRQPERRHEGWSVGDLLTNADAPGYPPQRPDPFAPRAPRPQAAGGQGLRLDEIARAIDRRTADEVWQRFRAGERGVLGRHLYSVDGQQTFDEISQRYNRDGEFRATVDRYIGDFERLLRDAEQSDPSVMQSYMTSETGRVYLLLAHASGRLR